MTTAARPPRSRRATGRTPARPRDPLVGSDVELTVGPVGVGGLCVARLDGRVVFVRHALPGEVVRARVTDGAVGAPLRADAVQVLTASPDRVTPPCAYAGPGRCGGCDWQHASLPAQRRLKANVVREQLSRLAGVDVELPTVEEVPGAPDGLGWRTRVQFHVSGGGRVGFQRHRSHDVLPVDRCLIAAPRVESLGVEGSRWPGAAAVEVIASATDRALVVTPGQGDVHVPRLPGDASVLQGRRAGATEALRGRPGVREEAIGRSWRVSGSGFWQVHPGAPDFLAAAVLDALQARPGESALDLYCGVGLFAGALASAVGPAGRVTAVESDVAAAEDARHNLADLAGRVEVLTGRVEDVLLSTGLRAADLVVLDPPRSGAGPDVTRWVCSLRPRRVAYVACDPASLGRDLALAAEHGYTLTALRAFDLFPMTQHVECLAVLEPAAA